jgi:hypothetical protein
MDCYYRDSIAVEGFCQVTISIEAPNEKGGITEARHLAIRLEPDFFKLRVSGNTSQVVIHNSQDDVVA